MAKNRMLAVFSVATLALGSGFLLSSNAWAETSADSINALIEAGETQITLNDDVVGNVVVGAGRNVSITLNGFDITSTSGTIILNEGTLTINGEGNIVSGEAYAVDNHGNLTINGGSYSTTVPVNYVNGTLTGSAPSLVRNGWDGPTTDDLATLTINGGTFTGGLNNVKNDEHGVLTISGGSFTNNDGQNVIINGGKSLTITGGTFVAPDDNYHFGLQNQSFGADAEKTVSVENVTLPSFGFSKTVGDSVYTVSLKNMTINKFRTNTPMSTHCTSITMDGITAESGFTMSAACAVTISDSTFAGGMTFNQLSGADQAVITLANDGIGGNLKVNGPIATATNCSNTMKTNSNGDEYRTGYNTVSRAGSKLTIEGGVWGYGSNSKMIAFAVNNNGELVLNDGAVVEGGISVETAGGTVTINNATVANGINMTTKFGGNVTVNEGTINGGINAAAAAVDAEADNYVLFGGTYDVVPDDKYIAEGFESDDNEEGEGFAVYPKVVDWSERGSIWSNPELEDQIPLGMAFGEKEFIADRKATLLATQIDTDNLTLAEEGELIGALEIDMLDRDGVTIEVSDNDLLIRIEMDEETYNALKEYDKLYAVYFNDDGEEVERFDAELRTEDYDYIDGDTGERVTETFYWVEFRTTHLSSYGIVGVNNEEAASEGAGTATPNTGTVTVAGASAMSAAIVTSIAVGLLTTIISFAYLIRRR